MKLPGNNKNLEDQVLVLTIEANRLEKLNVNAEALVRSWDSEIAKLRSALAIAKKEKMRLLLIKR